MGRALSRIISSAKPNPADIGSAQPIDDQSSDIPSDCLKLEEHIKKSRQALGGRTSLRDCQRENRLDVIIDYELAQIVPLAR